MEGGGDDYLPHHHHHHLLHDDTLAKIEPPPTRPTDDAVTSSVSPPSGTGTVTGMQPLQSFPSQQQQQLQQQQQQPQPTQTQLTARPQLTPRQKWLMAFNKICAQLVSARLCRNNSSFPFCSIDGSSVCVTFKWIFFFFVLISCAQFIHEIAKNDDGLSLRYLAIKTNVVVVVVFFFLKKKKRKRR